MDFENVDVVSLRNGISQCLNKISIQEEQRILNDIAPSNVWNCSAKENLITSIKTMVNTDYQKIIKALNKLEEVAYKIEEYKQIVQEIKNIQSIIKDLEKIKYITYIDSNGRTRKKLDTNVVNQINQYKRQLSSLNTKKNSLKNLINRLLSEI